MRRRIRFAIVLLVIGVGCFFALRAYTKSTAPNLPNAATVFQPVRPTLERSGVPLRLPIYIPTEGQRPTAEGYPPPSIRATVPQPQPERGYLAILGYSPDCDGGNACRFGAVSGGMKPSESIEESFGRILSEQSQSSFQEHRSKEPLSRVKLANGTEGWFLPWVCRHVCADAQVVWDEYSYRYSVGVKLGDRTSLIKMANSAIEAGGK